jgi:hypothetical protein
MLEASGAAGGPLWPAARLVEGGGAPMRPATRLEAAGPAWMPTAERQRLGSIWSFFMLHLMT